MSLTLLWIVMAVVGLVLLIHGVRGRRLDEHPVCRRCRFDLTGLNEGVRCPECGGDLAAKRAVRLGNRRRRGWAIGVGLPALLIGLIIGGADSWRYFSGFDLNTIKPTGLLVWELERVAPDRADGIAAELSNRVMQHLATASAPEADRKPVEKAHLERMRDRALAVQADRDGPWLPEWGDLLEALAIAGEFEENHWAQYVSNGIRVSMDVRSEIAQGDTARVQTIFASPRMGAERLPFRVKRTIQIDGRTLEIAADFGSAWFSRTTSSLTTETTATFDAEVGEHVLELLLAIEPGPFGIQVGPPGFEKWEEMGIAPLASIEMTLTAPVTILPPGSELVRFIDHDDVRRELMEQIILQPFRGTPYPGGVHVMGGIRMERHVIDLVVEGVAVVDGVDHVVGGRIETPINRFQLTSRNPGRGFSIMFVLPDWVIDADRQRFTLILRPNRQAALELPGVTEVFGDELVFEDIEIEMSSP